MSTAAIKHPASYRDPAGYMFTHNGLWYRQVNQCHAATYEAFMQSGLYEEMATAGLLLPHQEIKQNITGDGDWCNTLLPEQLQFVCYPYEWCFSQLRDAALLTLRIAQLTMDKGFMLKDASAFNIQFHKGRPVFIDTLSFEPYKADEPWIAYQQFCRQFVAPLAIMHYLGEPAQPLLLAYPEGLPLTMVSKMLPYQSKFHLHTSLHLHLHARYQQKGVTQKNNLKPATFSKPGMQRLLKSLETAVQGYGLRSNTSVWADYYAEADARNGYLNQKKIIINNWLKNLHIDTALDLGCNAGVFSEMLAIQAKKVISADADERAIDHLYQTVTSKSISNIYPLVCDFSKPGPAIGFQNTERSSLLQRLQVDVVLALAVAHHLAIGNNIPYLYLAQWFATLAPVLLIEFVPPSDQKAAGMLQEKKLQPEAYDHQMFCAAFEPFFDTVYTEAIKDSGRVLYFLQRKAMPVS